MTTRIVFIKTKRYERKYCQQVSPYGTLLSFKYTYSLGFLVRGQLCKSPSYRWVAPLLGLIGLCFPMVLTLMLVLRSGTLRKDFLGRFLNLSPNKWSYYLAACLLMPASILCAMAISLLFGYSPSQFYRHRSLHIHLGCLSRMVFAYPCTYARRTCMAWLWHRQFAFTNEPF